MLSVTLKAARGQGVVFVPCSPRHHVSTHNHFFSSWWQEAVYLHTEMNIFLSRWQYDNLWKFNHYYVVKQSLIPFSICTFYFHFDIFEELLEELGSFLQFSSVQLLSHVWLSATPWIAARQASLSLGLHNTHFLALFIRTVTSVPK